MSSYRYKRFNMPYTVNSGKTAMWIEAHSEPMLFFKPFSTDIEGGVTSCLPIGQELLVHSIDDVYFVGNFVGMQYYEFPHSAPRFRWMHVVKLQKEKKS